jgi:uncharacterized membrane protein
MRGMRGGLWVAVALCAGIGVVAVTGRWMFPDSLAVRMVPVRARIFAAANRADPPDSDRPEYVRAIDAKFGANRALTLLHLAPGLLFMVLAPVQLVKTIRSRWPAVHRWNGRIVVTAGLVTLVPGLYFGVMLPLGGAAEAVIVGPVGIFFVACFWKAIAAIRRRDPATHREWMLRAIAIAFGISFERLVAGVLDLWLAPAGVSTPNIFVASIFIAWAICIGVTEWWIRSTRPRPETLGVPA